ncbi:MAG: 2-amino-4-hydroxy-6-hydroxymethyldihydropteridine diphosphokinase [Lentisphaeria bacterium]|nr:2-amino-4-hydroxy-6-hydroxymethyldihydropteridine diphosphokinase [Candidatus Neomarinimicrobiota bacterium]MCF7843019.1 2-amino-4-hydroxy-6-hydroxymethyldihydropteridine diphosphokinase [Lentisphaeria bacterium]
MNSVVVSLGSNLNDPLKQLAVALEYMREEFTSLQVSSFYLTDPVGGPDQPDFVNACALFETQLSPAQLLTKLQQIEAASGRTRDGRRNEPRSLDIDIILYADLVLDEPDITLPHPRFRKRRFVLEPLAEIGPHLTDPVSGKTILELLQHCPDSHRVERIETELSA